MTMRCQGPVDEHRQREDRLHIQYRQLRNNPEAIRDLLLQGAPEVALAVEEIILDLWEIDLGENDLQYKVGLMKTRLDNVLRGPLTELARARIENARHVNPEEESQD